MIDIALPKGGMKKQLLSMIGIMAVLSMVTTFLGDDMQLTLTIPEPDNNEDIEIQAEDMLLSSAERKYEEYFMEKLNTNGISTGNVRVIMETNSDGEICVCNVTAGLFDLSQADEAINLIREDLSECEILTEQANEV